VFVIFSFCEILKSLSRIKMESIDVINHKDNVRLCLSLGWVHMLEKKDLENELLRLEEKQKHYIQFCDEYIAKTNKQINKIKKLLEPGSV